MPHNGGTEQLTCDLNKAGYDVTELAAFETGIWGNSLSDFYDTLEFFLLRKSVSIEKAANVLFACSKRR